MKPTLIILFIAFPFYVIYSQNLTWERMNGPYGGFISAIYQSSSGKIFAGGRGLLYSKVNEGEEWQLVIRTNNNSPASTIIENSYGELFASFGTGSYRSNDNGNSWELMVSGVPGLNIDKLAVDDLDNLYTSTLTEDSIKIYKSFDDGNSWNKIYVCHEYNYNLEEIKTGDNGLILGCSNYHRFIRSTDYGVTWENISYQNMGTINDILIKSNSEIYATESHKIWKSLDNGNTWNNISNLTSIPSISCIQKDLSDNLFIGSNAEGTSPTGGFYKSTDDGQTWINLNSNLLNKQILTIGVINDNEIWIGTYGKGIQNLVQPDYLWLDNNIGINDININSIVMDALGGIWLCTSRSGIFYSSDNGNHWLERSNGLDIPTGYEIKISDNGEVFLVDHYGVYRFNFNNNSWELKLTLGGWNDGTKCIDIKETDTVFAGSLNAGIAYSYDNGENWTWRPPYYGYVQAIKVLYDRSILAAGANILYRSIDNGQSWYTFFENYDHPGHITEIKQQENFLLIAFTGWSMYPDSGWVLISSDFGQNWSEISNNINNPFVFCITPFQQNKIFIGTRSGIFFTDDYGNDWQLHNDNLDNIAVRSILIDSSGYLFIGTEEGLYKSISNIAIPVEFFSFESKIHKNNITLTWTTVTEINNHGFEIQRNFENTGWTTIGFKEGKGTTTKPQFYSFTDKNLLSGKYQYRLKHIDFNGLFEFSKILDVEINVPTIFSLSQNYPNPFNPTTKIKYQLPEISKVKLTIYDVLGREIKTLVNEEKPAGSYEVEFGGTGLPSGVYFYRIEAGSFSDTKKFILMK